MRSVSDLTSAGRRTQFSRVAGLGERRLGVFDVYRGLEDLLRAGDGDRGSRNRGENDVLASER